MSVALRPGQPTCVVAATDETAWRHETIQHGLLEGPGIQAMRTGHSVLAPDLSAERRWPTWCARSRRELGLHAVLAIPLMYEDSVRAVLGFCWQVELTQVDLARIHHAALSVLGAPGAERTTAA